MARNTDGAVEDRGRADRPWRRSGCRVASGVGLLLILSLALACAGEAESSDPRAPARTDDGTARAQPAPAVPEPPGPEPANATSAPAALPPRVEECAVPGPAQGARLREAIVYARPGRAMRLDLALPPGAGPHPVVLVLHGGGWSAGERAHVRDEILTLAGRGYAAAAVDYRLLGDGAPNPFPTQIADARCAVRHLRQHAGAWGLDPDRIAAVGFSAGGHLAELLATAAEVDALDGDCVETETSAAVRAAVAFYAPSDLRPEAEFGRAADRIITRLLGASRQTQPDRAARASPITYVDGRDAPLLLVHGTDDTVVPVDQSRRMRAALSAAGAPVQYVEVEGAGHGFRMFGRATRTRAATCTALSFLRATLR